MDHVLRTKKANAVWKIIFSVCLFALILLLFLFAVQKIGRSADANGAETLRESIQRATVQCYAVEGRYPPDVKYLEEHYGIKIDQKRFHVFYEGFASNIIPDITVVENKQ